jgi:sulfate permease, SulP family
VNGLLRKVDWDGWQPKLISCLKGYTRHDLVADSIAGVTVGLVALPLAMAFGIASGVSPQAGIYTAILGGLLVSALGGSRIQRVLKRFRDLCQAPCCRPLWG